MATWEAQGKARFRSSRRSKGPKDVVGKSQMLGKPKTDLNVGDGVTLTSQPLGQGHGCGPVALEQSRAMTGGSECAGG